MPVDFGRLYDDPDPDYLAAVWALVEEVDEAKAAINAQIEAEVKLRNG